MSLEKIGIIGYGNMGSALALGLKKARFQVAVSDLRPERKREAEKRRGLKVCGDTRELIASSDVVVLAVKPQDLNSLIEDIGRSAQGKLGISIIAGRGIKDIMERLSLEAMARFMPNLAATIGRAAVGVSFSPNAPEDFRTACLRIARSLGTAVEVPERLMAAVTGLSGSGIAYAFSFLHAMALGGVKAGIDYPRALEIALAVVQGAAALVQKSGENPQEWLSRVISPAGTTIAGIAALEQNGFTYAVMRAVEDAAARAQELEA